MRLIDAEALEKAMTEGLKELDPYQSKVFVEFMCYVDDAPTFEMAEDMREATTEERKSTTDYINSISKPTGVLFEDAYEELDFVEPHKKLSANLQLCEDCISREAIEEIKEPMTDICGNVVYAARMEDLRKLPSVRPQPCEDAVSRDEVLKAMAEAYDLNDDYDYRLDVERKLKQLPSVTPQPKRGHWIVIRKEYEFMGGVVNEAQGCKCSNCGGIVKFKSGFCPSCGSYNGGEKDGNE